jgi:hypothetical protein
MTQQIIDVGAAANDGTGEPLRNAFTAVNDNFTQIWTAGPVGSQVQITGNIVTTTVTNLGLTLAGNGIGNITANSTIVPGTASVYDLGAPNNKFQYIYGDYLVGNGALITGIVANTSYNNSNVAAFLPTYTGNLVSLTGPVRTTANVIAGNIITSGFLGVSGAISGGNITGTNLISSGYVSAVGNITTAGNISGNYLLGNGAFITGITATNIAAGALTGTVLSSNVVYSSLQTVGNLVYVNVDGNVTTTGRFIGSGAGLTNIPAANIVGTIANASYATTAGTAYSVSAANVFGTVANATYAITAGSATTATIANTANAVAGANVTGVVANAAYAITAGSATTANTANTAATVTTAAQPNITSVGTLTSVSVSGNTTAGNIITGGQISAVGNVAGNYFIGNGALLTGIVSNASANANALVGTTLSSNVLYSSLQAVGNLVYVNVDGNITTSGRFIGSGAGLTNIPGANVSGAVASANVAATVTNAAQPNITSVGILTSLSSTGNVTANYFVGNGSLLTGIVVSNVNAGALVGTTLSSNVIYSSLQAVGNLVYVNVDGNITTSGRFIGSGAGLTNIPGANVSGNVANATYAATAGTATIANNAITAATVTTNAQPNITSVGTLTSVSVSGNASVGRLNIGQANLYLTNTSPPVLAIQADTTQFSSSIDVATNIRTYSVTANATISAIGNITGGNLVTAGNATAAYFVGNGRQLTGIVATSVGVLPNLSVTGNIVTGNLNTSGIISAAGNIKTTGNVSGNYFVGNGALLTGITVSAGTSIVNGNSNVVVGSNGNVTVAVTGVSNVAVFTPTGIEVTGLVSATGNVTANNLVFPNGAAIKQTYNDGTYWLTANLGGYTGIASNTGAQYVQVDDNTVYIGTGWPGNNKSWSFDLAGNLLAPGNISAVGNIAGSYLLGNGAFITGLPAGYSNTDVANYLPTYTGNLVSLLGPVTTTSNVTAGNVLTGGLISATGNVTGNYILGNGALLTGVITSVANINNGTSNVTVVSSGGNITVGVAGTSNVVVFSSTGEYVTGVVSATGNVTGNYFIGNGSQLTGVAASSVNANALIGNTLSSNVIYSSLTTVGTLANLSVTGNVTGGNVLTAGLVSAAGNLTGGNINTAGLVSTKDFGITGNITGNLIPSANVTYNIGNPTHAFKDLYLSGNSIYLGPQVISANATGITVGGGDLAGSNVVASNAISAGTTISAVGNITGGNIATAGLITATGNAIVGNVLTGGVVSATANITGGNIRTAGLITATGNVTGGNVSITGGTLAFANASVVQTNPLDLAITGAYQISVKPGGGAYQWTFNNNGSLSGPPSSSGYITVTGNVIGANLLTGGAVSATGNIIGGNVNTSAIQPVTGGLTISTASGNLTLQPAGNIVLANTIINSVAYPQQDQDAASKIYVDNMVSTGLAYHTPVAAATTTTLATTTGGTITYTQPNGVSNGVGALLTTTGSFNLIDTANVQTIGTRILVKNEGNAVYNGVYTWANATNIIRSTDTDSYGPDSTTDLSLNDYFFVQGGNVNKGGAWVVSAPSGTITFGTSNITFSQFSSSQTYTANTDAGISLSGTQINAKVDQNTTAFDGGGNIIVKAGANLTTPNIGAATGTSISLTGNVTGGNINTGGVVSATANVIGGNLLTGGLISATANITGGNIRTAGLVSATGNIAGNFFIGNGSQLTGVIASGGQGNTITLGTPTDGNLVQNVAYPGWTTATFVTDGLDDLNQVALNIANSTYVGNTYITANVSSGPSPLSVSLTGRYIGNPNAYLWQFGDGTANVTTANAVHTFSNVLGGTFTVTYTAYNTNGTYNGNAANGAKGSTSTASTTITLYTPTPIPSFTANRTSLDTPGAVLITNTSQYAETYSINWGDGTIVIPANNWTTASHTFTNASANTDVLYGVNLTGNSANAGASPVSVTSSNTNVKVYSSQASNVFVTANRANVINGSGVISFRNDSNGAPGNTASFGAQQYYYFNYGDGNISNVTIASGTSGNPGAANVTNTFALSAANQSGNIYQQFTANLSLYTGYSTSPFKSGNITITVEPQTRANFVGTTANVVTDATANTGNARVGYLYTDYNGANRSTFTFQNTSENSNIANWTWGDATFSNGVSNVGNVLHTYNSTGVFTVSLQANGTPNGITSTAQSNTFSTTGYIFIAANPTAPTALSGFANLTIANASQGTSPLLAAGATDATGGNIPANGTSVTRFATTATITTSANVQNANTATTGTLTAYVNNTGAGNVTFTTSGNTVGTTGALVVSADRDLHVANAAVPSYFYKVFSANVSCALSSLSTGYNNYKMVHSVSGNTNYVGFVKDNLNTAPSLVTGNVLMVESTAGTYRYISGIPYYNTGSPAITIANLQVANLAGQTYTSTTPFTLDSGTLYEGSGAVLSATQTKTLAQLDNAGNSMLTGSNVKANIGVTANYTFGNLIGNITGANNSVSTLQANILNVIGTGTTVQLPTKIQTYAGANSGVNEQSITCTPTANTQAAIRIVMSTAGNTPAFSDSTNFYTANAWSGAQTIAGTPEAVVRYGVLTQYAVDLSTGYLPVGPNLSVTGSRTSTQYFTFAFARPSLANFDIRLTTTTGVAGVWLAAPGTTIDKSGFSSPTPGFPGPTSTINGWLEAFTQYAGSGVPGAAGGTGGNGSNGCALTGADVIPLNTAIANVGYTMTLGSQNAANSTGNNILIRIALASGQSITALSIGVAA